MRPPLSRSLLVVSYVVLSSALGFGPLLAAESPILSRSSYLFPSYAQAVSRTDVERYASKDEYETAAADTNFELQKLSYLSDGLRVICYLYQPTHPGSRSYPAIVFNRGSFVRGDIAPELLPQFHRLGASGFVVLAPLYRGSDGGEGRDEMGGADVDDLMGVVSVAEALETVDTSNLFLYGESRGGMMTYQAIRDGFPANAAAVYGAFTDLGALIQSDPARYEALASRIWPDYERDQDAILQRRSAVAWSAKLDVPLLILHGGADGDVDPQQSLELAERLNAQKKEFELTIYANDDHVLSDHRTDRDARAIAWFERHMR